MYNDVKETWFNRQLQNISPHRDVIFICISHSDVFHCMKS